MLQDSITTAPLGRQRLEDDSFKDLHGMTLPNSFRVAWEGVMLNKLRSFLTTLGIIIGVAAVIIMLAVSAGAEAEIEDQISGLGANLIMVTPFRSFGGVRGAGGPRGGPGGITTFTYDEVVFLSQNLSNISGVSLEQSTSQTVKGGAATLNGVSVVGVTADFLEVRDYSIGRGRFFTHAENEAIQRVAILGAGIAEDLFEGVDPIGQQVRIGSSRFTVIGVMAEQGVVGATDNDGRIYIPASVVFKRFGGSGFGGDRVRMILVKAESGDVMEGVMEQITSLLAGRRQIDPAEPNFGVRTQQDIVDARASTTAAFRSLLAWVAAVSLVVGGIGIMNIMLVSVTERTREIGLRQALGARPRDVQRQFLLEAVMLSLVGGLAGLIVGVGGSFVFGELGGMRTELVPLSLPLAFGASAAVGIFFGYYPATQAAQLDPIEALRRE
ncbi:MAG: ABC transporter permease [Caldilineaceae bacterium]|nr:ABC transporter permease [Caldilineaceae bacterium]MDE0311305.1 ABC transporter permease [Caldilineaceae bacterium]